jgi:hypothetical protein
MTWDIVQMVQAVADHLFSLAQADDDAQAVYSIDVFDELQLHPHIHQALQQAGYGVWPEQRYPGDRTTRRRTQGKRCDVVLTPGHAPLLEPDAEATLFAADQAVPLEAAFWMEIKTVAQFTTEGPFPRYSAELLQPVSADLRKMARDPMVFHAGLLLVLFNEDARTARHDLLAWHDRCLKRGYPVAAGVTREFPLNDRIGNAHATVALYPLRRL